MQGLQNIQNIQTLGSVQSPSDQEALFAYLSSGAINYYPLDESSGVAVNRGSTFGSYNGTVSGATQGASGLIGDAYSFDGDNDSVTASSISEMDNASGLSLVTLINADTASGKGITGFRNSDDDDSFYMFALSATSIEFRFRDSAGTASTITATVSDITSDWTMLGLSLNSGTLTAYQDGASVGTPITSISGSFGESDHGFAIGHEGNGTFFFDGLQQHVAAYNTGLTSAQMLHIARLMGVA